MIALLLLFACGADTESLQGSVTGTETETTATSAGATEATAEATGSSGAASATTPAAEPTERVKAGGHKRAKNPGRPAPGERGGDNSDEGASDAPITLDAPAAGAAVPATFELSGTAMVYEGQLTVEALQKGQVIADVHPGASVAAPERGKWSATLQLPSTTSGEITVQVYSVSARDGSPENVVQRTVYIK